jgi:hypothetical protein
MHWKEDNETFHLVLVLALETPWIILCDHTKVLHHKFGQVGLVLCQALTPSCVCPPLLLPQP